jgi:O-antigen/teichoic acid export membrane protein
LRAAATVTGTQTNAAPLRGDTIARNAGFALAAQIVTATLTAGLTVFLVRSLSTSSYGLFALALAIGSLVLQPADLGISQSTARFIAERRSSREAVASVLADALRLKLIAGVLISGALFALAGPIADAYGETGLAWPLRAIAIAVFAQGVMTLWGTAFVALQRVSLNLRIIASESAVETGATVALVLLGAGATGAAFGRAIGYGCGAVVALLLIARLVGRGGLRAFGPGHGHVRRIAGYAGALMIVDGAFTAFAQVDALIIGAYLSAASVGLFQAPYRLTAVLAYPGLALGTAVAPRLSPVGGEADVGALQWSLRYLIILQAAIVAAVLVWAEPIISLALGGGHTESAHVLRALAPYIFAAGFAPVLTLGVNYLGEARRRVPIAIATVLINVVIDLVLIPRIGIVGGAIGTDVAFSLYVAAHLWIANDMIPIGLRSLVPTVVRSILGGVAAAAVLLALGTSSIDAGEWIAGAVLAPAAFAATVLATGEFSRSELGAARRSAGARLGRRRRRR